jgi:hypothetical protein
MVGWFLYKVIDLILCQEWTDGTPKFMGLFDLGQRFKYEKTKLKIWWRAEAWWWYSIAILFNVVCGYK